MPRLRRAILVGMFAVCAFHSIANAQAYLTTYVYRNAHISNVLPNLEDSFSGTFGFITIQRQHDNILSMLFTVSPTTGFYQADGSQQILPATLVTADVDFSLGAFNVDGPPAIEAWGLALMLCNPPLALTVNVMHTFASGCPVSPSAVPPLVLSTNYALWHATWETPDGFQFGTYDESDAFLISVTVAPEPATIALLAIGLTVIGLMSHATRRRRRELAGN
jgi:hypothetical protein